MTDRVTYGPSGDTFVPEAPLGRRPYLDWLRGAAVLVMVLAHTTHSWTMPADRTGAAYRVAMVIGGFGAPAFLFLAGVTLALAAEARVRRGNSILEAAGAAARHGLQLFALAFVIELTSWMVSGGGLLWKLTRVDILHVMGVAMCLAALMWATSRSTASRMVVLGGAAVSAACLAPVVGTAELWRSFPEPLMYYFTRVPERSVFTLFPWTGFVFGGAAFGVWLAAARIPMVERRVLMASGGAGVAIAMAAYAASFLPTVYDDSRFWSSSPAFFFLRLGVLLAFVAGAAALHADSGLSRALRELGTSSLFVYWVHLELVYGTPSLPIHRGIPLEVSLCLCVLLCLLLLKLVQLKNRATRSHEWPFVRWRQSRPASTVSA